MNLEVAKAICHSLARAYTTGVRLYQKETLLYYYSPYDIAPDPLKPFLNWILDSGQEAGSMAYDGVRQIKNRGIGMATFAAKAAIRGGVDLQQAYLMVDIYTRRLELTQDFSNMERLIQEMLLDFAGQVEKLRCPVESTSPFCRRCVQYISQNVFASIRRRDGEDEKSCMYMLSTDGFANSYTSDVEFQKTCNDYFVMIREYGAETVQANLKKWLTETSELGCGDDITAVMAYFEGKQ